MNILIIEDEPLAVVRLKTLLLEIRPQLNILGSLPSVEESIIWLESNPKPDLIIMDISLADGSCFEIFSQIEVKSPLIFITAYDQFAIEAFKVFSIDYLLKPVSKLTLEKAFIKFESIRTDLQPNQNYEKLVQIMADSMKVYKSRFLIKAGKRMFFKETDDISYFSADDKAVFLISRSGEKWLVDYSLDKLDEILDPKLFFRLNRKMICRIEAIKEIISFTNSRLKVSLQAGTLKEETIISRERVQKFKLWAEQ